MAGCPSVCIHPSIRLSIGMYLYMSECCCLLLCLMSACPPVHLSVSLYACPCESTYVQPSVLQSTLCIQKCLYRRVNVGAVGEGKTFCLSFYLIVNPPIRSNVIIQFFMFLSVYQFVYCLFMCPSIRPSVKCKSACVRI